MSKRKQSRNKKKKEKELKFQTDMLISYYKKDLVLFVERELGIKLTRWQKFLISIVQKGVR